MSSDLDLVLNLVNGGFQGSYDILWILRPEDGSPGHDDVAPLGNGIKRQTELIPGVFIRVNLPASAQAPIVLGPTPPSTSISFSGNRARSSDTFGTHLSRNF